MPAAIPNALQSVKHRKVRAVFSTSTPEADALIDAAAGDKESWTPAEWEVLLDEIRRCESTVEEWWNERSWLG